MMSSASQTQTDLPYLHSLNDPQRQAVETLDGAVLVLAGAGTGKTRVLTTRMAHLIYTGKAHPQQILSVTFTNKAAREMRHRVEDLLGRSTEGMWMGTFHSIGVRILRRHAELVKLKSNFTILDDDDQQRLLKQVLQAMDVDIKRWPPRLVLSFIQRWKDRGLTPDRVPASDVGDLAEGKLLELYKMYQGRLQTLNAVDFGDLLLHGLTIFQQNPDVLADYQKRFHYILVDEYQDTNVAQYLWLRLLAQHYRNICCVGDDDQSIYGWRGAEVGNILRFEKDFPGAEIVRLEQNYRSTEHILGAAGGLISHNEGRLGKTLWTDAQGGELVTVRAVWDGEEEARVVADEIESRQRKKTSLDEMAILVRASFQTREFEERFLTLGIPYRVVGGLRFYERMEIRDALAYLRLIYSPDDGMAFERILNTPKRGLADASMKVIRQVSTGSNISMMEAALLVVNSDELRLSARNSLGAFLMDVKRWRDQIDTMKHTELAELILEESGYVAMWQNDKSPDAPGRLENLKELIAAMGEFENLAGFLEHVSLVMENNEAQGVEMVNVMTLHSAKGLEFDTVFLPGWEEDVFPHRRALDETGQDGLEEERRLAYVGMTRAKRKVFIFHAANRRIHGQWQSSLPSRFIGELPPAHLDVITQTGLYGGYRPRTPFQAPKPVAVARRVKGEFELGERVFHQKFGYGTIESIDHDKFDILFEKAGRKKVIKSFVEKVV